jgi:AAA15 family ATPase/GTPase
MLKNLQIKNFRGFRDLKIEPLKRVNLITGQNNTGKTAVLEALVLLLAEDDASQPNRKARHWLPHLFRSSGGDVKENFWKWLFNNKDTEQTIHIKASFNGSSKNTFEIQLLTPEKDRNSIRVNSAGHKINAETVGGVSYYRIGERSSANLRTAIFSTIPTDPTQDAAEYQRVILKRKKKQVEKLLREIEPRLESVEALRIGEQNQSPPPLIYADLGLSEMIPVTQLGQGFNRLLDIYSEIVVEDAKVLLIDEIENGLHYSVLPVIWKGLFSAAKEFDVQIFATTHSWECILAADQAARENENYDLALIRLDRVKGDIKATVMDEKSLSTAKELHWEMR